MSNGGTVNEKWNEKDVGGSINDLNLRYYLNIYLEGLRKTMMDLSQDSWSSGQGLNLGPLEYEAGLVTTWP
jgi:hypothetical protein